MNSNCRQEYRSSRPSAKVDARNQKKTFGKVLRSESGLTLIEVVISIALLLIVGAAVAGYFSWSFGVFKHTDVRATEESIARSEMEIIKGLPYTEGVAGYPTGTTFSDYSVTNSVTSNVSGTPGLQKVTVLVSRRDAVAGTQAVALEGYKLNR